MKRKERKLKMNNKNNATHSESSGQGNFFSGFLLGLLVGAAIVFLLATKKGKKLLKVISEGGIDNISNILDTVSTSEDLDESVEEEKIASKRETRFEEAIEKPKVRRFFRGISRRVN